jgi:tRNA G10  N-methylase Trm11
MPTYLFFLGNHQVLSATEIWGFLTIKGYEPRLIGLHPLYAGIEVNKAIDPLLFELLGGVERVVELIKESDFFLSQKEVLELLTPLPAKLSVAVSVIDAPPVKIKWLVNLKKEARALGSKLAFIEPARGTSRLSSAQVLFHGLYRAPNAEITIIKNGEQYLYGRTIWVQDIQDYEKRDTGKPGRDAKVGMLPPKLAQIMVNIAAAAAPTHAGLHIIDPFCGTGVILQEGWLQGHTMTGSDIAARMIDMANQNMAWVKGKFASRLSAPEPITFVHDVNTYFTHDLYNTMDAVVSEPFLGEALNAPLPKEKREEAIKSLQNLYVGAFKAIHPLLKDKGVVVFIFPAWRLPAGKAEQFDGSYMMMPQELIDEIKGIGYSLEHLLPEQFYGKYKTMGRGSLLYSRPDAFVGREITLWRKN